MSFRTDRHNNPAAITTDLAKQAGLKLGVDYEIGDPFPNNKKLFTARLKGEPVMLTIFVIDRVGYYTKAGLQRWSYIALPDFIWKSLSFDMKKKVVAFHYKHEGGTELKKYFI